THSPFPSLLMKCQMYPVSSLLAPHSRSGHSPRIVGLGVEQLLGGTAPSLHPVQSQPLLHCHDTGQDLTNLVANGGHPKSCPPATASQLLCDLKLDNSDV